METCIFQVASNFSDAGGIRRAVLPPGGGRIPLPSEVRTASTVVLFIQFRQSSCWMIETKFGW